MSDNHQPDAVPPLTTTRIGGGRRAWLIALTAVVVLGVFVYLGLSGGQSVLLPRATPTVPAVAVVPTPVPQPARQQSFDPNEIVSIRADPTAPVLYQYLGTALTINSQGVLAILDSVGQDAYRGIYRIPVSQTAPTARLEFDGVTASVSHDDLDRIGEWTFPINSIANGTGPPVIVLDTGGGYTDATLSNPDFNRVLTNGYHLTVTTQNQTDAALMTVDVTVNPALSFAGNAYEAAAGPADNRFGFELESFGQGGYDGQALIPTELLGTSIPVTVVSTQVSNIDAPPTVLGTWSVSVPMSVAAAQRDGSDPVSVHDDSLDLSIGTAVVDGALYLTIVLNERAIGAPIPTR